MPKKTKHRVWGETENEWTLEDHHTLRDMVEARRTDAEIAHALGRTETAVRSKRGQIGFLQVADMRTPERVARLRELALAGMSDEEIADEMGVLVSSVHHARMRMRLHRDRGGALKRTKTRPCMCCQAPFVSEGKHNRLCGGCRTGDGGLTEYSVAA